MIGPSLKFPAERVVELETELKEIRTAFEQYIANSKELEAGLDKELMDLHGKLKNSTAANNMLAHQLQKMQPVISELEKSLTDSKSRLKQEAKLRLEAEKAKVELESRCQEIEGSMSHLRQENECLRDECEVTQHDLDSMIVERRVGATNRESDDARSGMKYRTASPNGGLKPSDSYGAILDELEGVTEQLLETQHRLWKAEDELRESQSRVRVLETSMQQSETRRGNKMQTSLLDLMDDETIDATVSSNEQKLAEELERVKADLAKSQQQLRVAQGHEARQQQASSPNQNSTQIDQLRSQIQEKDRDLKEFKEQNAMLVEEVSCLRDVLQEHNTRYMSESKQNAELRSKEINALREKLKVIVKENASLKEQVNRLENGLPASRSDDVARLKKEILHLQACLQQAEEQKTDLLQENDIELHLKLEKLREELLEEKDREIAELRDELLEEKKLAETTLEEQVERLADENFDLEEQLEHLQDEVERCQKEKEFLTSRIVSTAEHLSEARDEIVSLKKKSGILSADLEHAKRNLAKMEAERSKTRDQYAGACAELEVARQILDEAGLDGEMIAREDEKELKQQIHSLSKTLEQTRQEYAELENDFLDNQHRFCDSQEEASRKAADEIDYLSGKVAEMEAALEAARMENAEISSKLQQARKKIHQSVKREAKEGRESTMRAMRSEKLHDLRSSGSEEHEELNNLRSQLGDMMTALDKVHGELREYKAQLEASENENLKIRQEIEVLEKMSKRGIHIVDKSFLTKTGSEEGGTDSEGFEVVRSPSSEGFPPFSWFTRDQPGRTQSAEKVQAPQFNADELKSHLSKVTEENELLKAKVAALESSNAGVTSLVDTSEVKKIIIELEEALKANEKTADELERVSQKLSVTEKNLELARQALHASNDENRDLRSEMQTLNDSLFESRRKLDELQLTTAQVEEERSITIKKAKELQQLQDQLKVLTDEKIALQHQFDDSKIALSMSQYAQERSKEELRATEAKLSSSTEEICKLKHELTSMSRTLSALKHAYEDVREELRQELVENNDRFINPSLTLQLKELEEENGSLQQLVNELKEALDLAQNEIERKSKQVDTLHHTLVTTQQETRLLTEEITSLTTAFEVSMTEYNNAVKELEELRQKFEPARREAKWNSNGETISEMRKQLEYDSDKERLVMKQDVDNAP